MRQNAVSAESGSPLPEAQGKILQICHGEGSVKVDSVQPVEHGIQVEGVVQVRILYSISDDEMPFYSMETMIPFSQMIEGDRSTGSAAISFRQIWSSCRW